MTCSFIICL